MRDAAAASDATRTNLPAALTSFVGREREVDEVGCLLTGARLLTLTGSGGCGKTRLALEVAARRRPDGLDGVWLADLAALNDPDRVVATVAAALGIRDEAGRSPLEALAGALRGQRVLLVLDNCEHLLDACAHVAEALLRACPDLRVLATSREPLGVAGEVRWRVPSLAVPVARMPLDDLAGYGAVRLFVERAAAVRPGFALTVANAPAVVETCIRLDGIPLAIELAAARVAVLPPEQVLERLDDRFRLLTGGGRTALPRQQTLRAAVDWSYDLLTAPERTLFDRLSIFAGGWTVDAAEAICAGEAVAAADVFDLLARLVDKSLVQVEESVAGAARFRLLETLRQYGAERLTQRGETDVIRARHATHYLALVEQAAPALRGADQGWWLARLAADADNLRTALRWLAGQGELAPAYRLAGALWRFWAVRGYWSEGRTSLADVLARTPPAGAAAPDPAARAAVLQGAGALAFYQGDYSAARTSLEESLALQRAGGDTVGATWSLIYLAWAINDGGDPTAARPLLEEALALARAAGDQLGVAWALGRLGLGALFLGEFTRAAAALTESEVLSRALGDRWGTAWASHLLAMTYTFTGEPASGAVERLQRECLATWRDLGARRDLAYSLYALGMHRVAAGEPARAEPLFREALPIVADLDDVFGLTFILAVWSALAAARGQAERALHLAGAVDALCAAAGLRVFPPIQALIDREVPKAERALGPARATAARATGRALAREQVVAMALVDAPAAPSDAGPLTARERDVAALIARGLTNRQIAAELSIAERTVSTHVAHMLGKLDFATRAQIAAWATERGLTVAAPD
jgi:predicted ATPase/DNA-binding CsgD family transcriptional regulator